MKFIKLFFALFIFNTSYSQFNFEKIFIDQGTLYNNETAYGDFDKNGEEDIIVTSYSGGEVNIYFQNNKVFTKKNILNGLTQPSTLFVSDFNKDGRLDFVISYNPGGNIYTFLNDGSGESFTQKLSSNSGGSVPVAEASFDINKDGYLDLILGYSPLGIRMLINKKDGTFERYNVSTTIQRPGDLVVVDFNKDNRMDIVATSFFGNELTIFWGNGANIPIFVAESIDKNLISPNGCEVSDIDNDGINEILVSEFGADKLLYYAYDGALFWKYEIDNNIRKPTSINVLDLNKDGFKDIVCYGQEDSVIKVFKTKNQGSSFESYTLDDTNDCNSWMTFVDWDKDNDVDIIVPCKTSLMYFENKVATSSNKDLSYFEISIYPNPVEQSLNIQCEGFISCKIVDLTGRVVLESNSSDINVSHVQSGLYTIVVKTNLGEVVKKLSKI